MTLIVAATIATTIWWATTIATRQPTAYPQALYATIILIVALRDDTPLLCAAAGLIAYPALHKAILQQRYGNHGTYEITLRTRRRNQL